MAVTLTMSDTAATQRRAYVLGAVVLLQAVAALFFAVDSTEEVLAELGRGVTLDAVMECLIGFALLAGVIVGALHVRRLLAEARRHEHALAVARGALAELLDTRFAEWDLSAGEAEVALFAIKGCTIGEIAALRGAASGTVRSQLSQVYAKAGVNSQSALVALFIDDLL